MFFDWLFGRTRIDVQPGMAGEWTVTGGEIFTTYDGDFILWATGGTIGLRVRGRIVERPGQPADVFMYDPPPALRGHPHGPCFQLWEPDTQCFKLHWNKPAWTFDASRAYVEQLLAECYPNKETQP